jgi:hypothetical protein
MMVQTEARELFRAAYENRYTWDASFPGFKATVTVKQGDEVYTARATIHPDLTVEVTDIADEKVQESIYTQLRDVVTHRKRNSFDQAHGKHEFSYGDRDDTGAIEILVTGDAMGSNYKLRNNEVCQVSRVMGRMAFTIDHQNSLDTGNGYVSTRYDAIFRNPQTGDVMREMEFEDSYEPVGDYYLMTRQVIRTTVNGKTETTEFIFSDLELLPSIAS